MSFDWGGMAGGVQDTLEQLLQKRILEERMALAQRQQAAEEQHRAAVLAQGDSQFNRTQGHTERVYGEGAPQREATLEHTRVGTEGQRLTNEGNAIDVGEKKRVVALRRQFEPEVLADPVLGKVLKARLAGVETAATDVLDPEGKTRHGQNIELAQQYGRNAIDATNAAQGNRAKYVRTTDGVDAEGNKVKIGELPDGTTEIVPPPEGASWSTGQGMSAMMKQDIADMATVEQLSKQVLADGERLKWSGVGGMYQGSINDWFAKNLGSGTEEEANLRANIANIFGTIAKLRGGTALTDQERVMIERYTPTIDDSPLVLKAKLGSLLNFIQQKRSNSMAVQNMSKTGHGLTVVGEGEAQPAPMTAKRKFTILGGQ